MGYISNITTPENSAPASDFVLEEIGGKTLTLRDRALPYRPISINGRQRAEFTWYPGSPNATVQMLGPEEGTISLRGFWKDRFLVAADNKPMYTVVYTPTARLPSGGATHVDRPLPSNVATLVDIVDNMRRMGRQIKLSWSGLLRYGHITSFTQTWHNVHDCEWELEFSVLSHDSPVSIPEAPSVPVAANLAADAFKKLGEISDQVNEWIENNEFLAALRGVGEDALTVQSFANSLEATTRSWANSINNVAQNAVTLIQTPNEVGLSLLGAVTGPTVTLFRAAGAVVDSYIIFGAQFGGIGAALQGRDQDDVAFGIQLGQKSYATQVKQTIRDIETSNAVWRSQTTTAIQGPNVRIFVAQADTDLRDVSTQYYKTPDNWRELMLYNGLSDSKLVAGQIIKVPQRLDGSYSGQR